MHKKILTVLSVVTCLLLTKSQANDIEPTKEFYTAINKGTATMVIDGTLSEWTGVPVLSDPRFAIPKGAGPGATVAGSCAQCVDDQASPNYVLWESLGGTWTGPDDQTSAVEVVWDADNVYLGFIVTDDYHENQSGNAWNGDSVQLMIATEGRSATPSPGVTHFLYNFALLGVEADTTEVRIEEETPPIGVDPDVEAVVRRDVAGNKTYYEIRLSASALNLTPPLAAGMKFGLGMAINDGDELQPGQMGWGGLGAHSIVYGKHPSETALVTLSADTPGADLIFLSAIAGGIDKFSFRVNDKGTSISDPASVKVTINGATVTPTQTAKTDGAFDVTYTPAAAFASGSTVNYTIEVKDTAGAIVNASGSFNVPQYASLTAADKVTADTTKRGFVFKVHQNGALVENSYVRAIDQLEGRLGPNRADPAAQGPALAPAVGNDPANTNKPITFEIETVVNLNVDLNTGLGNFPIDDQMPGTPGIDPTVAFFAPGLLDGVAADITTYVELTAGIHTLIVNSDDGFKAFMGRVDDIFARQLAGSFDALGGRGAADTAFTVMVAETGVYALRVIFHQGGGGGNIELVEQLADGTKVLLNDDVSGGPKTYRAVTGPAQPTAITSVAPGVGSTRADGNGPVTVIIAEGTDAVTLSSIVLKIDNVTVPTTPVKNGNIITVSGTPADPLTARALHNASITYTAGTAAARTETWSFTTVRYPSGTLFIEGEDFNFGHGQVITDQPIGMTGYYPGGGYLDMGDGLGGVACDGSDFGIDYSDNNTQEPTDATPYRQNTNVEAAKRNGPAGRDRGLFFVDVNHTVGWTSTAEWMNFTRDFPTTGTTTYNVFARMAHGEAAAGTTRGGILSRVTSDPAVCDQTTAQLGRFSGPWTGGWDTWPDAGTPQDALLPMVDTAGSPILIRLTGKQTLRWQFAGSAGDLDYIVFVPVKTTGLPPVVTSVSPAGGTVGWGVQQPFNATITKGEFVTITSASLTLDGVSVPATVTLADGGATVSFTPTAPLAPGSHTYVLSYTDNASPAVTRTSTINFSVTFTPYSAGTLFIETEDFNFEHGKYDTANEIGMNGPYPGGTYANKGDGLLAAAPCEGSDYGIDYNDAGANEADTKYRPDTRVAAGKRNGPAGLNRQLFQVQVNHVIGWTGTTEWMNYTRQFPAAPTAYRVYARMAHGDAVVGVLRGGVLSKVTGDVTLCADPEQIPEELGTFQAPWTGGWDTWPDAGTPQDAIIPMKDATGADAKVTLSGLTTLRFQFADNAGDIDYLAFVPVGTTPPKFLSFAPAHGAQGIVGDFEASLQDQDLTVTSATLLVDGAPVSATVTKVGDVTTIKYSPTNLAPGSTHTYTLNYTLSSGATFSRSTTFRLSFAPLPAGTLFIEGEDFNFGHGLYVTDAPIGMTGAYPGGSYQDQGDGAGGTPCDGSDYGIDYNDNATQEATDAAPYRSTTNVEAAKRNGSAGLYRGTFNVEVNHVVGWTSGAEWMNYTRDFPATPATYKVYARMAHGDAGAAVRRGGILFTVQGDPTLCATDSQTTTELGRFNAPWTGAWDTWPDAGTEQDALIPMKDAAGAITTVTLGGKQTIRFQFDASAGDLDYIAFVPSGPVEPPGPRFTSVTRNANGSITVVWEGGGTLETTAALGPNQTWTPVPGANSPFTFTPNASQPMLFARISRPQ